MAGRYRAKPFLAGSTVVAFEFIEISRIRCVRQGRQLQSSSRGFGELETSQFNRKPDKLAVFNPFEHKDIRFSAQTFMPPTFFHRVSLACALLTAILGTLTLIGWTTGLETLASIRANYIPMAPSTALAFGMLGTVMLIHSHRHAWRLISDLLIAFVAFVAGAKLFEFFSGLSLGIDELFVANPELFGSVRKGRMSPITAFNFLLISFAVFALARVRFRIWASRSATLVLAISFVVVLGYLHGTPLLYGGNIIPVALPPRQRSFFWAPA
jgi:hypothetical protein